MVDEARRPNDNSVLNWLRAHARKLSFYEVVALLERLEPDAPRVGGDGPPLAEHIRLRTSTSMAFATSDIEHVDTDANGRFRVTNTFLGLYGASSPLPVRYSEELCKLDDEREGERTRAFLDIVHHRFYALLYRAWSMYLLSPVSRKDRLFSSLLALAGIDPQSNKVVSDARFDGTTQVTVHRTVTVAGLEALLSRRLNAPFRIEQFQHRRAALPPDQRSRLGRVLNRLGDSFMLGSTTTDRNRVRIVLSAQTHEQFDRLAPGSEGWNAIKNALSSYLRTPIDHDVVLEIEPDAARPWRLGLGNRLGCGAWLGGGTAETTSVRFDMVRRTRRESA